MGDDDYPILDPTTYDLIVTGTGLPSSLLAAASAAAGKSVLQLDPNPFYGSHFSSLPPDSLSSFRSKNLLELSGAPPEPSRSFSLDLAGPRLLYCADRMVDLLLRSGASNHVEFKSVDGSLIYSEGAFISVPDSRQAIFRDRSLGLGEKREMMRFLKQVQGHIGNEEGVRISDEELEMPFVEFLKKQKLPRKIRAIILYAIVLADYDQDSGEGCKKLIKTKEGIESIALYIKSVGRYRKLESNYDLKEPKKHLSGLFNFCEDMTSVCEKSRCDTSRSVKHYRIVQSGFPRFPNAVGAFIYPIYGHGELPQAFCRCAAVKGALYVLRMPVLDLLVEEKSKMYKGVKLASGQEIFSQHLIIDSSSTIPSVLPPLEREGLNASNLTQKVARGVCIASSSLQQDLSNILVIFPPRSLNAEQLTAIRALQLSSNVAVCPQGMFVVYLSTLCDDGNLGKEYIHGAMRALFSHPKLDNSECVSTNNECAEASKPPLLWSAVYVQEATQASFDSFCLCPMPDAHLDYRDLLQSTMKLFSHMYPKEEFLPESPASGNDEDDCGSFD